MMKIVVDTRLKVSFPVFLVIIILPWIQVYADSLDTPPSPPKFKQDILPNKVALVNDSPKFVCRARGQPKPYITWYYNNELLETNERINVTKYSLQISNLMMTDGGKYSCRVRNDHGEIWGNFTLKVYKNEDDVSPPHYGKTFVDRYSDLKGPPVFTESRNMVGYIARAATATATVEMDCSARSYPKGSISWWRDGTQIIAEPSKYVMQDYKLKISSLTSEDTGDYTCIVSNEFGNISHTYKLEVQQRIASAPIMEDVKNQTAVEGDNVTFTCKIVMSDSHPLMQWLRHYMVNESFTNEKGEPYVKILESHSQQSGFLRNIDDPQELVLTNVTQEDEGWYTCLVANTVGMNYRSAWLEVLNKTEAVELETKNNANTTDSSSMNHEDRIHMTTVSIIVASCAVVIVLVISVACVVCRFRRKHKHKYAGVKRVQQGTTLI